jgi:hypothetical protein
MEVFVVSAMKSLICASVCLGLFYGVVVLHRADILSVKAIFRQSSLLDCHDNLDCEKFTACPHDLANKNPARDFGGRLGNLALLDSFR